MCRPDRINLTSLTKISTAEGGGNLSTLKASGVAEKKVKLRSQLKMYKSHFPVFYMGKYSCSFYLATSNILTNYSNVLSAYTISRCLIRRSPKLLSPIIIIFTRLQSDQFTKSIFDPKSGQVDFTEYLFAIL